MVENIEKIIERGDMIDLLVGKTATMQELKKEKCVKYPLLIWNFGFIYLFLVTRIVSRFMSNMDGQCTCDYTINFFFIVGFFSLLFSSVHIDM